MDKELRSTIGITIVVSILLLMSFPTTLAEDETVTINWYIPDVTTIDVALLDSQAFIEFRPTSGTFDNQSAYNMAEGSEAINITNTGTVDINLNLDFAGDFPTGVTYFRLSSAYDFNDGLIQRNWDPSNETVPQVCNVSVGAQDHVSYYVWSSGVTMTNDTHPWTQNLVISTVAT